jgi:hypothetical protein
MQYAGIVENRNDGIMGQDLGHWRDEWLEYREKKAPEGISFAVPNA